MKRAGLGAMTAIAILASGCLSARDAAINDYVDELGKLDVPDPSFEEILDPTEYESGPYLCTQKTVIQTKLFDTFPVQGSLTGRIYPGALLDGNSLQKGLFNEVPLPRKPMTLSTNLVQRNASTVMENPSLSSFRQAQLDLIFEGLDEGQESAPKFVKVQEFSAINESELSLELGFDVSAGVVTNVDVAGQFSFNRENKQSRYLVRIINELYTINIDKPAFASDFFADEVSFADVQRSFGAGNPPVYVDSVIYGRSIYIAVESNFSSQELQAALEAALRSPTVDASLEFGLTARQVLEQSSILGIGIGISLDDQADLGNLKDPEAIQRLKERQATVSRQSIGEPIAFTVAYLTDNSSTVSYVDGDFPVENCQRATQSFVVRAGAIRVNDVVGSSDQDLATVTSGTIKVSFGNSTAEIFRTNGGSLDQVLFLLEGQTVFGDSSSLFSPGLLENVSLQSGQEFTVELDLVVNTISINEGSTSSSTLKRTFQIPTVNLLDGIEAIDIVGAGINATLFLDFEAIVSL
jgi:hypothetical protein